MRLVPEAAGEQVGLDNLYMSPDQFWQLSPIPKRSICLRKPLVTIYIVIISAFLILAAPFFAILAYQMITSGQLNMMDNIFLVVIVFCFPIVLFLAVLLLRPQIRELMRKGGL
jgi:hypothetical protein